MATKIIKSFIDGVIQEIEVEDILSPAQNPSYEERLNSLEDEDIVVGGRLNTLEDKHNTVISKGNFLVGDGTTELKEIEPSEVLTRINGANIALVTEEEFNALDNDSVNANTIYLVNDGVGEEDYYTKTETDEQIERINTSISDAVNESKSYSDAKLNESKVYTDEQVATKSQVQIISTNQTENITENLATLKIHKLSKTEYEEELANGNIDENALYLTPDEDEVGEHNISPTAHSDIRLLITELATKLNKFLNMDDDAIGQLSEILTLIDSNKGTLESLTTSKVNISDIVDNLVTSSTSKVLSANQGVVLKRLIDTLQTQVDGKSNSNHHHNDKYDSLGSANTALEAANTYTNDVVSQKTQIQIITLGENDTI